MTKLSTITSVLFFVLLTQSWSSAELIYGEDLAWKLANPKEIRKITNIRAKLRRESKNADPLFILTPRAFDDIDAAPNTTVTMTAKATSWDVPPWPALDPALPDNMDEETRKLLQERRQGQISADVWSELAPPGGEKEAYSRLLRPRVVPIEEQFVFRIKEIPDPFSLRRYYDRKDIFVEIAAYGGTTSFKAEEAFRALKEAATRQTLLEGIGQEAFLTRIEITESDDNEDPNAVPFADLAPTGEKRPDLLDSGSAQAMTAPAFQELPVKDLEGRTISYVEPHKRYKANKPKLKQSLLVVVAFYPDEAITVTVAMEERLGSVQDLMAMSMMVQRKIKREIKRRS